MEQELQRDLEGIRTAVEKIFTDEGGAAIVWLGECLGKEVQKQQVKKGQIRKFLTELKAIKEYDEFALNRFRWVCRYIVAQEKRLKLLGDYLQSAAEKVSERDAPNRFKRLQNLMESVYAHYCYSDEVKEERRHA